MPAAVRARLFDRFVNEVRPEGGGGGLGLSIVQRIAEHLHWTLQVEDRRGGGTRVYVALPELQSA
jgi:signal transduction histidine kinase